MIRRVVLPWVSLAGVLLCLGCTGAGAPAPHDPEAKLELRRDASGHHGGASILKVGHAGGYTYNHSRSDDRGRDWEEECEGGLEATSTHAWIDRVAALPLVPYDERAHREMIGTTDSRSGGLYLVYHPSTGAPLMPATASAYESVADEANRWLLGYEDQRPAAETCRVIRNELGE